MKMGVLQGLKDFLVRLGRARLRVLLRYGFKRACVRADICSVKS